MRHKPILVDIGALACGCSDHALEALAKSMAGEEASGPDIWARHESPFIQSLIELFSSRGLLRLEKVRIELVAWLAGKHHKPTGAPAARPMTHPGNWTPDELSLVRVYLENLPPGAFQLSDWTLVVDYLIQRYLPAGELASEAEWLAVRAAIMGKVQASLGEKASLPVADAVVGALPLTTQAAQLEFDFDGNTLMNHILEYGKLRCAGQVTQLRENARHRLKREILDWQEQKILGTAGHQSALQTRLFDTFSVLNRDWRRIAVTEAGENVNQGLIASLAPGTKVRRLEQYRGACPFCRKIHGRVFTVVDAKARNKNGETEVWVGKNNIGRAAAPRKRVGDELIERDAAERWWVPAGTVHPHCRGMWTVMDGAIAGADPVFQAWLEKTLAKPETPHAHR
ncbi:MAG TPA: hypothetical protein VF472_07280 [Burkholderiaceae bacterium]